MKERIVSLIVGIAERIEKAESAADIRELSHAVLLLTQARDNAD